MKKYLLIPIVCIAAHFSTAQEEKENALKKLLNHVVGGTWVSTNENNEGKPEDFKTFYMNFSNWSDDESATGNIYGISNAGDTTQLMQVWNFVDKANQNLFLVQRDSWGGKSVGTITPYEEKNLDIQFKTTIADGRSYYTRDIHYFDGKNKMKAVTYHKAKEEDEWQEASTSEWVRKTL